MTRTIRVVSVGPGLSVQGGISRVIELIQAHLPCHIGFRHIATFTRYTGDQGAAVSDRGSRAGQAFVYLRALVQIAALALRRSTVFHVHFSGGGSVLRKGAVCALLRAAKCTYVVHSHAADTRLFHSWVPRWFRNILLWGIGGASRVLVLTQFWREYYTSLLHLPANRLLLLPNPAHLPSAIPDRTDRSGLRLLFLGRVGQRKGAFDVIRAFAQLPQEMRSTCHLTLAGDGDGSAAKTLASELGCSSCISVPGWAGTADVEKLLEESDILLLPSYAEGMAMALIEGMSWGLAVVTTNAGGASDFLEHRRNSIVVSPGDVNGICDAIGELANDSAFRLQLGQAARDTISRYSIGTYIDRLSELYRELARGHAGRTQAGLNEPGRATSAHNPAAIPLAEGVETIQR